MKKNRSQVVLHAMSFGIKMRCFEAWFDTLLLSFFFTRESSYCFSAS